MQSLSIWFVMYSAVLIEIIIIYFDRKMHLQSLRIGTSLKKRQMREKRMTTDLCEVNRNSDTICIFVIIIVITIYLFIDYRLMDAKGNMYFSMSLLCHRPSFMVAI